ncbi:MAG: FG-GAP-like repeat-containing protein [Thermodesulfovibrionales bacterium]
MKISDSRESMEGIAMKKDERLFKIFGVLMAVVMVFCFSLTAEAAPVRAQINGEIDRIIINNPADHWSGGIIVVNGGAVILPKNLLIDLPANRLTLKQIFDQAPAACIAAGETGLAKGDTCNKSGTGGIAAISANRLDNGNVIAGDVLISKGAELVTGTVTFINYTDGYLRVNGNGLNATQIDDNTGVMIRLNDPSGRHTLQQGLGCIPGALNCSPDPRFTLDPDNYTNVFISGFPLCIPSTSSRTFVDVLGLGTTTAQGLADGTGDVLCPSTNRTISNGQPVDDSRRFAPLMLGDSITAEGNYETINCVRFISSHTMIVSRALTTKFGDLTQPDYMFLDEVGLDAAGFQNQRARTLLIGFTTESDTDVMVWSLHRDPVTNQAHEFPLATVKGCDAPAAGGPGTCGGVGLLGVSNIFKVRHDVDFLVGADPKLDPCTHLNNDIRMGSGFCPGGSTITNMFGVLGTLPHEIQARTGKKFANPGLVTIDIQGNQATNGQYLFPLGINLGGVVGPEFVEINLDALNTPFSFSGIPWNLDRRLSPGGCSDPVSGCGAGPYALDPFPYEGIDPRTQAVGMPTGAFSDPNFTATTLDAVPYGVSNRILSYVTEVSPGVFNFNGNSTILAWPPASPALISVPAFPPVTPQVPVVSITSLPGVTATQGQQYSYQVVATNPSPVCGPLTYTLDLKPVGMIISAEGLIQWTPTLAQVGPNSVTVRVTDPIGFFDTQSFVIVAQVPAPAVQATPNNFDGDGKTDLAVWRPSDGNWWVIRSSDGVTTATSWGAPTDLPVTGDYDGDGRTDLAVWRPSDGNWWVIRSSDGVATATSWGAPTDLPVSGDYDGDGKTDLAVWRPSDGNWWVIRSSDGVTTATSWGAPTDLPVAGDYDGDGKTDLAVWRPSDGNWWVLRSSDGVIAATPFGTSGDIPVTGDYDGDGKTDLTVWRPSDGNWWILRSSDGVTTATPLGISGDTPVYGDYDGDGKTDIAVWRDSDGTWRILGSALGATMIQPWGTTGDLPIGKMP